MTQQKVYGFIPADGYTLEHCVPATKFHPEVNVKFRPATPIERVNAGRDIAILDRENKVAEAEKRAAEFMASKLVSWDLVAPPITEGASPMPVEINVQNLLRLECHLSGSLLALTLGDVPAVQKENEEDTKN